MQTIDAGDSFPFWAYWPHVKLTWSAQSTVCLRLARCQDSTAVFWGQVNIEHLQGGIFFLFLSVLNSFGDCFYQFRIVLDRCKHLLYVCCILSILWYFSGFCFCLWLSKVSANKRWCYFCIVFSHWLIPCSVINRKQGQCWSSTDLEVISVSVSLTWLLMAWMHWSEEHHSAVHCPSLVKQHEENWHLWCRNGKTLKRARSKLADAPFHTLPGHQQPWYWSCGINGSMSSKREDFNYLCHL